MFVKAQELATIVGLDVTVIIRDGKSLQTYFSNTETSQRIKPQLSQLFESEIAIKQCDKESECKILGATRKLGFHKFAELLPSEQPIGFVANSDPMISDEIMDF